MHLLFPNRFCDLQSLNTNPLFADYYFLSNFTQCSLFYNPLNKISNESMCHQSEWIGMSHVWSSDHVWSYQKYLSCNSGLRHQLFKVPNRVLVVFSSRRAIKKHAYCHITLFNCLHTAAVNLHMCLLVKCTLRRPDYCLVTCYQFKRKRVNYNHHCFKPARRRQYWSHGLMLMAVNMTWRV